MDKGTAMTGFARQLKASLGLVLLTGLVAGCATTPPWAPRTPEVIQPQVCGGNLDSDGDGVNECLDRCPGTLRGESVDPDGCPPPPVLEPKPYRG
jgi:OOP family OmpA-OmpF porin